MFMVPRVLQCIRFILASNTENRRIVRDYEFDLYMGGERDIYIDDHYFHITKGAMVFRKPGQLIVGYGDYDMYMMTLDFGNRKEASSEPYYRNSSTPQQERIDFEFLENLPQVFYPKHIEELVSLYGKISDCTYPNIDDKERQKSYITEFLFLLMSDAARYLRHTTEIIKDKVLYVKNACNFINGNYDKDITVAGIAEYLSINKNYFIRIFKEELGITPNKYIMDTRLFYSKTLLVQSQQPINRIAEMCGFKTPSYYIKCFKHKFGTSPLNYRNEYENNKKSAAR